MPLTTAESRVCAAIAQREQRLLTDLTRFVAIPTGPGGRAGLDELRAICADRLRALGATIELIPGDPRPDWLSPVADTSPPPPTLLARRPFPGAPARILLSGHLDTVHDARGGFRALSVAPDGKTATGPGCVDMKGGIVIALAALEALDECGLRPAWSFILNSDEETGSYHSDRALRAAAREHDLGLALEPAMPDGGLVVQRPGSGQFLIETRGRAAHVGRDFTAGVSAVTALAHHLLRVAELPDPPRGIIANVGPLEGGIAANVVPDRARAWGNVRYPTSDAGDDLRRRLEALATPTDAMPATRVLTSFNRPAKPLTPGTQHLADLARAAATDLALQLPFGVTGGVCDGNNLQDAGLPTIDTLGVRGGGLHTPTEWIDLASLVPRCRLLALVMIRATA